MSRHHAAPTTPAAPATPDQAFAELQTWLDVRQSGVAELTGPAGSGRTGTLRRVHEASPGSLFIDATGLTCEDIVGQVMAAAGAAGFADADWFGRRRSDWGEALRGSPLRGGLVVIANAQRAGRTRRSEEPDRMVHRFSTELAFAGDVKVLVERDLPDVRRRHDHLVVTLRPADGTRPAPALLPSPESGAADALLALSLAEPRLVPVEVWRELRRSVSAYTGRPAQNDDDSLTAYVENDTRAGTPGCTGSTGCVRFRDESLAVALRDTADPGLARAVNRELVAWLRRTHEAGTGTAATARYLSQGLAMHAVQAGEFGSVQRAGRLVAHIDQVALIDAALANKGLVDEGPVDARSPAGDAINLWAYGVDSLPQDEWASWLHLMSTARGDNATAADIAASGRRLPWRVRWSRWRPPGAVGVEYVRPGPLAEPSLAPADYLPGRYAVSASGEWDHRTRVWDAETGEDLAGPWPDEEQDEHQEKGQEESQGRGEDRAGAGRPPLPAPGQREPLWLPDDERDLTPAWVDLTVYEALEAPFLSGQVAVGDVVVVTGLGGVFAVDAFAIDAGEGANRAPSGLAEVHGEPMWDDHTRHPIPHWRTLAPPSPDPYADGLFEPSVVRKLPAARLPEGVTNPEARRFLTETGLPAVTCAEMQLLPLDERELTEPSPDSLPDDTPPGTYVTLGTWVTSDIVLHGPTGQVHLLNADEWVSGYEDEFDAYFDDEESDEDDSEDAADSALLIAVDLPSFVRLLHVYLTIRCTLASAGPRAEREGIRYELEHALSAIDEAGAASGAWTTGFTETD
ncbi:SUKH-4 family immunity protein [Streptomyces sp. Da 82-17]|uniref:SUKH-4 family immunity protein n=1 Tax=Streptomyces sp. Da 82-17 TaxID=3377116 RepID=UPI0038D36E46